MVSNINQDIQTLANQIKRDVESSLSRSFNTWDVLEHDPIPYDPEHTTYRMKVKTDDNGHVKVKTVRKDPGSAWETHVEEFDKGNAIEGGQNKALEGNTGSNV